MSEHQNHDEKAPVEAQGHEGHGVAAEGDSPRTTFIFLFVVVSVLLVGAIVIGVDQIFRLSAQDELSKKVLAVPNTALRQLRTEEEGKLTRYQWVDQKAGVVRIPVERAMQLVAGEWAQRPAGVAPAAEGAPQAPGAAPAAGGAGATPSPAGQPPAKSPPK